MKMGIIIIFNNYEKSLNVASFIKSLNKIKSIQFCLVNNDSQDETNLLLEEIKYDCNNVTVVNIKKFKSDVSAVKSGARYMFNQFKLNHLGYINTNVLHNKFENLITLIKTVDEYQNALIEFDKKENSDKKKTLFQKLFSVMDYVIRLKLEKIKGNLQHKV
ncbi:hypothetical protein [Psychroserpens sp. Hel_I_66]|uniref:hypothetical protein n=1 Tax=Psychroserpens sp. Hel_I_66 TaxID=1250004 RepID=UPI0006491996|nr:hypothetical protein [Psychroserpens sp. Hel_I_66]